MTEKKSVLVIGLQPTLIDFSDPDYAAYPGMDAAKVLAGLKASEASLTNLGRDVEHRDNAGNAHLKVAGGIAGVGALALSAILMFGRRDISANDESTAAAGIAAAVEALPKGGPQNEIEQLSITLPANRVVAQEAITAHVSPPPQPIIPDCEREDAAALANAAFAEATKWLYCTNKAVAPMAEKFLSGLNPDQSASLPPETQAALVEALTDDFHAARSEVLKELAALTNKSPNAFVVNKDFPPGYQASRLEVHEDQYGVRRPMIVYYNGQEGKAFSVPNTAAGSKLALKEIMMARMDGATVDPSWYQLFKSE